jgi:hypothetical protein
MPAERTTMRQAREVLRLKFVDGVPTREIVRRIGVAASLKSVVGNAVSGLLAQSERGSFLFPFGVLRNTPPSIRHQPPAPVVKFFGQRCPNVEAG